MYTNILRPSPKFGKHWYKDVRVSFRIHLMYHVLVYLRCDWSIERMPGRAVVVHPPRIVELVPCVLETTIRRPYLRKVYYKIDNPI